MPVLLSGARFEGRQFMVDGRLNDAPKVEFREGDARCIDIGLVNNMSDSALEPTVRQIIRLLDAAAVDLVVRLRLYSLPEFPRTELGRRHLNRFDYGDIGDLWDRHIDGLVITGAEPRASHLNQEPYWKTLTSVFDWAERSTLSTISSCLAVHAAVLHFDGIGRRALDDKCFGIFEFETTNSHPMMRGVASSLRFPHSRWNEVREGDLASSGYTVIARSGRAGVDTFVKQTKSLLVFFQGHPEYEAWTLLSEYRRDIERFLRCESGSYPPLPVGYFDDETARSFSDLRERAMSERNVSLLADISHGDIAGRLTDPWRPTATRIYRNWLLHLSSQKV